MTERTGGDDAQPAMLPGLRAVVADSRKKAAATRKRKAAQAAPAEVDPVAQVLVDLPLAHLDRTFDYLVPATMAEAAVPGGSGQGPLRRPGRRRLRGRAAPRRATTPARWRRCAAW